MARLAALALLLLAAGCGPSTEPAPTTAVDPGPATRPTAVPPADGPVTSTQPIAVTDDGSGPMLCFSDATFGGPPDCHDVPVAGWSWPGLEGLYETTEDRRVGSFLLTGEYDGEVFTPTDVKPGSAWQPDPIEFEIPCPTPEGGWQVLDAERSGQEQLTEATAAAQELPGFAMAAVSTPDGAPGPRDSARTVLSVYVTSDPAVAEEALRRAWGGMLCVTQVQHSLAELTDVQAGFQDVPGVIRVGSGNTANQVEVLVFHDDGSIQAWADQEYGEGVVVVESVLQSAP